MPPLGALCLGLVMVAARDGAVRIDLPVKWKAPPWTAGPRQEAGVRGTAPRDTCTFRYLVKCVAVSRRNFGPLTAFQFPPAARTKRQREGAAVPAALKH